MVVRVDNNNGGQNIGGQGIGESGKKSALDQLRNTFVSFSVEEEVIRAELYWLLKMVQSDFSFKSADNMVDMLRLLDKESKIFPRMTLGRQKCGYYITHALYPFYLEALIKRILEAPAYTLGVDGGSFKVRGLKSADALRQNLRAAELARMTMERETKDLNALQEDLARHMGKKPKIS